MVFHKYPMDKVIDFTDLKSMVLQTSTLGIGSHKPKGDNQSLSPRVPHSVTGADDIATLQRAFSKKYLTKHGWHLMIFNKSADVKGLDVG